MIRLNLRKLQDKLNFLAERKVLLKEISERSGVEKNALSRLNQHPEIVPSSGVIDKLAQYFFLEFKAILEQKKGSKWVRGWRERRLMEEVIDDLISVYPDNDEKHEAKKEYWSVLPDEFQQPAASVSLDTLWSMYERLTSAQANERFKDPLSSKTMGDLAMKVRSAKNNLTAKGVQLSLSEDELNLLNDHLSDLVKNAAPEVRSSSKPSNKTKKNR